MMNDKDEISIKVNGNNLNILSNNNINDLLTSLEVDIKRLVVEFNGTVLNKDKFKTTILKSGDVIEVVQLVAGG